MTVSVAPGTHLRELDAFAKKYGFTVRLDIAPGGLGSSAQMDRPTVLAELAVYDGPGKDGHEIEAVKLRPGHTVDDAAGFLLELVKRTPTPED